MLSLFCSQIIPLFYIEMIWTLIDNGFIQKLPVDKIPGGGGGGHSTFIWTGGAAGGRKPDPVTNHSARKKYTLSQYTLLKLSYAYPVLVPSYIHKNLLRSARAVAALVPDRGDRVPVINIVVPHAPSLVPRLRACHKHCGLGTRMGSREATL